MVPDAIVYKNKELFGFCFSKYLCLFQSTTLYIFFTFQYIDPHV